MKNSEISRIKWSEKQNLIYQIFILLQWGKQDLKRQKRNRFKELQLWLGRKKTALQCYNHHKKKLHRIPGLDEDQLIRNIIKSNYTQRSLSIDHILIEAKGHLKEILDQDQQQDLQNMTNGLITKLQSFQITKTKALQNQVNKKNIYQLQQIVRKQNKHQQILEVSRQNQNPFMEPLSLSERDQISEFIDQQSLNDVLFTESVQND